MYGASSELPLDMASIELQTRLHGTSHTYLLVLAVEIARPFVDTHGRRVIVEINGHHSWHAALSPHRDYGYYVMVSKANSKAADIDPEAEIEVVIRPDESKYGVEVPEEFLAVLETDPEGEAIFERMTDGGKRSVIHIVKRVKSSDNRIEKSLELMEKLKMGITDRRLLNKKGF